MWIYENEHWTTSVMQVANLIDDSNKIAYNYSETMHNTMFNVQTTRGFSSSSISDSIWNSSTGCLLEWSASDVLDGAVLDWQWTDADDPANLLASSFEVQSAWAAIVFASKLWGGLGFEL